MLPTLLAGLVLIGGCTSHAEPRQASSPAPSPSVSPTATAAATRPFSFMVNTAPCFGWDKRLAGPWIIRDAVTGANIATGKSYQGRCGFSVQFQLTPDQYAQNSEVYAYDSALQFAGVNQSNASSDQNLEACGDFGPLQLTPGAVIANGAELIDQKALGQTLSCPSG